MTNPRDLTLLKKPENLIGLLPEIDEILRDFAYLAAYHAHFHPANTGDVSQVLSHAAGEKLLSHFSDAVSEWIEIKRLDVLQDLRADGRAGYRSEGISDERFYAGIAPMAGRVFLITRTGSQIPSIQYTISCGEDGKLFNAVQVDDNARRIRLIYGHHQYGSIPSIETHIHIYANAQCMLEGLENPATVHAHPFHLISLGRHVRIQGSFERLNAAIYTQIEGLNRNYSQLIGVVPYYQSGTAELVINTLDALANHRLVLWMNHGFTVREANIRRAYTLLAYAEDCARATLFSFKEGGIGLPEWDIREFLESNHLNDAYKEVFGFHD